MRLVRSLPVLGGLVFLSLLVALPALSPAAVVEVKAGNQAPEFSARDIDGKLVSVIAFRGRVVLLHFWATWCASCREEMPSLEKIYARHGDRGLRVVGVASDSKEDIREFFRDFPVSYSLISDPKSEVQRLYGVRGIPVSFVVDRRGIIVGRGFGGVDWLSSEAEALIEKALRQETKTRQPVPAGRDVPEFPFPRKRD
jgi:peroxiredoxin